MILYPASLPKGLQSGRTYQTVSPLKRSELASGRSRQRRNFTSVPTIVSVQWLFNSPQAAAFEAWFRDALIDGSSWFSMPLKTDLGFEEYELRFQDIYNGPSLVGPDLWSIQASLETKKRIIGPEGYGLFPDYIVDASIFDIAMNSLWPLNQWDTYMGVADTAINEDWPTP